MSLRDFLIRILTRDDPPKERVSPKPETHEDARLQAQPFGKVSTPLDVLDRNGKKICSCRLREYGGYTIRLERLPGDVSLPILKEGDTVQVKGYTTDLKSIDLQGLVHKSTRTDLDVGHIQRRNYDDMRASFRQPVYAPAELYKSSDRYMNTPEPCQLVNISTGGACVMTEKKYELEEDVLLRVELYPDAGTISFHGRIIRAILKEDGEYEYGIIFAQITQQKKHDLERDMEELRRIMEASTYK